MEDRSGPPPFPHGYGTTRAGFDKLGVRLLAVNFHSAWLMPGTAVLLHCQRPTAFSVFSHARRRDNRVCYAFSHNGQVHAPPAPRCKESGGPRERERGEGEGGGALVGRGSGDGEPRLVYKCAVTELVTR